DGEQSSRRIGLSTYCPIAAEPEQKLVFESADLCIGRFVEFHPIVASPQEILAGEKCHAAPDEFVSNTVVVNHICINADVFGLPFKHGFGFANGCSALPLFNNSGISGTSQ